MVEVKYCAYRARYGGCSLYSRSVFVNKLMLLREKKCD